VAVQTLKIDLLGASFTIQTDETREYMESILAYIRRRAEEVQRTTGVADSLKTSILTSVYLVDELFRERPGAAARNPDEIEAAAVRLIERLERPLLDVEAGSGPGGSGAP